MNATFRFGFLVKIRRKIRCPRSILFAIDCQVLWIISMSFRFKPITFVVILSRRRERKKFRTFAIKFAMFRQKKQWAVINERFALPLHLFFIGFYRNLWRLLAIYLNIYVSETSDVSFTSDQKEFFSTKGLLSCQNKNFAFEWSTLIINQPLYSLCLFLQRLTMRLHVICTSFSAAMATETGYTSSAVTKWSRRKIDLYTAYR